jgi:hypothetical protein
MPAGSAKNGSSSSASRLTASFSTAEQETIAGVLDRCREAGMGLQNDWAVG